jgi:hypothetical protein
MLLSIGLDTITNAIFTMVSLMLGSVVIVGDGWGKIRFGNEVAPYWKLFGYAIAEIIIYSWLSNPLTNMLEAFLMENLPFAIGIFTFVLGIFFVWFVYTFDFDIRTDYKWAFPVVCFLITGANVFLFR